VTNIGPQKINFARKISGYDFGTPPKLKAKSPPMPKALETKFLSSLSGRTKLWTLIRINNMYHSPPPPTSVSLIL